MKRKIIAIVLAVGLVTGSLGNFVLAQEDGVNDVGISFSSFMYYETTEDQFFGGHKVNGELDLGMVIHNRIDESAAPITDLTVTLDDILLVFDQIFYEDNLIGTYPPYIWEFDDLIEDGKFSLGMRKPAPSFPVTLKPLFDATRSMDKTEFLQSEGTQTQTLTITLTPHERPESSGYWFAYVAADDLLLAPDQDDLVDVFIPGANEQGLYFISIPDVEFPNTWSETVEIEVTPNVPRVEFKPCVGVCWFDKLDWGTTVDNSISYPAHNPEDLNEVLGTWIVNATGDYNWNWDEVRGSGVEFRPSFVEPPHETMIGQKLVGWGGGAEWSWTGQTDVYQLKTGFFVENPDAVSEIDIDWVRIFASDGEVIYEGKLLITVDDELVEYEGSLKPHEKLVTGLENYELPPPKSEAEMSCAYTVEIFWSWTDKKGLPLTGWASSMIVVRDDGGEAIDIMPWSTTQMMNMEQVLTPVKEERPK